MPRPTGKAGIWARLHCARCGRTFMAPMPHLGHKTEDTPQEVLWERDATEGVVCANCGSTSIVYKGGHLEGTSVVAKIGNRK